MTVTNLKKSLTAQWITCEVGWVIIQKKKKEDNKL